MKTGEINKITKIKPLAQSVKQNVAIPAILYTRAMKMEREKGEIIPSLIRTALSEYLTKHNY